MTLRILERFPDCIASSRPAHPDHQGTIGRTSAKPRCSQNARPPFRSRSSKDPPQPQTARTGKPRPIAWWSTTSRFMDLLFALARDAKLNVDIHPGITGYVSLNAIDQTLPQLLTRIAKQVDMRFELDGPNLTGDARHTLPQELQDRLRQHVARCHEQLVNKYANFHQRTCHSRWRLSRRWQYLAHPDREQVEEPFLGIAREEHQATCCTKPTKIISRKAQPKR